MGLSDRGEFVVAALAIGSSLVALASYALMLSLPERLAMPFTLVWFTCLPVSLILGFCVRRSRTGKVALALSLLGAGFFVLVTLSLLLSPGRS